MRDSEVIRYKNTLQDLTDFYCELGPGGGEISMGLKGKGKNMLVLLAHQTTHLIILNQSCITLLKKMVVKARLESLLNILYKLIYR